MAASGKVLGTVTSVVGEVKAIAADGTVRILQVGDKLHADETLNTGTLGSVNIVMENGATLDCGANTELPLHEGLLGVAAAVAAAPATAAPSGDVAALQAAIAAGQDPSQVAQATAAGGAPAAGGGPDSGGAHSPVILEQTNSAGVVSSGFPTEGAGIGFPSPEFLLLGEAEVAPPTVSVGVDVSVEPGDGGSDSGIVVSGNTAGLIEGTNGSDGKLVTFVISLSQAFDEPVTVSYAVMPGTAQTPSDYFDGETLTGTVTIPAGETEFFVLVQITQDHLVEGNETFNIVLTDAINATIDPNADEVIVTIVDDDLNPIARDDAYSVNEGQTLTGNVLSKVDAGEADDDTAQGPETLQVITAGEFPTTAGGTVVLAADGSFTYTPPSENFNGPDSFEYTIREMSGGELINDPDTATVTINVVAVNDPPVAAGEAFTTQEDTALTGSVTGNESDIEDGTNLTYVLVSGPSNSEAFTLNADGSFSYMPTDNYNGPDSFTYKVVDSDGLESNVVTADITVTPVNDPPVITPVDVEGLVNESGLPTEDRALDSDKVTTGGSFTVSDIDGDTITLSQIQFKPSGADGFTTVAVSGSSAEVDTGHGILSLNSTDGGQNWAWSYELYAPVTDGSGNEADEFKVTVTDGTAQVSSDIIATVTIVDDLPAAVNDVGGADEDQTVVVNVLSNDLVGADVNGTLVSATLATTGAGSISFDAAGNVTFDPAPGFQGPVTINYTMQDVDGDVSNAILTITVSPDSEPTVDVVLAEGDDGAADESALAGGSGGGSTSVSGTFPYDTGNDDVASLTVDGQDVTNGGTVDTGDYGTLEVTLADGVYSWTYTLNDNAPHTDADATGSADQFPEDVYNIVVTDSDGDSDDASLTIQINDDGPVAADDGALTPEDTSVTVDVLANDAAGADSGKSLVSAVLATEGAGTVEIVGGQVKYTPAGGFEGDATISYVMQDAEGDTSSASLVVTVGPDSEPTVAVVQGDDGAVDESALPTIGSGGGSTQTSGTFPIDTGNDDVASLTVDGQDVTNGGTVDTGDYGTLEVTLADGVYSWTYTLNDNAPHTGTNETGSADQFPEDVYNIVVTDSDGDTDDASLTIQINDDGPKVTVTAGSDAEVLMTTQDAETDGTPTASDVSTANFSGVFTPAPVYGADGSGATTMSYGLSLTVAEGTDSGLDSNGASIYLYDVGGVIVGSTATTETEVAAGNTVFSLSVNGASGVVTLTQDQEIDHANNADTSAPYDDQFAVLGSGLVQLTGTATTVDSEGDSAVNSTNVDLGGNVRFADDGPSITAAVADTDTVLLTTQDAQTIATASDTDVSTANFGNVFSVASSSAGADSGGGTSWSYALSLKVAAGTDSGLDSDGAQVNLYNVGGVIVGATSAPVTATDPSVVFSLSVSGTTGEVTLTQYKEIDHANDADTSAPYDDQFAVLGSGLVQLTGTVTITDGDGDQASSVKDIDLGGNVRFADDGPSVSSKTNLVFANDSSPSGSGTFDFSIGGDGREYATESDFSTIALTGTVGGSSITNVQLTPGAEDASSAAFGIQFDYNNGNGTTTATGTLAFDKLAGTYTVTLNEPIAAFTTASTSKALDFTGYEVGTSTIDTTTPHVVVAQLTEDFYVQFTGMAEPGSGTGENNLQAGPTDTGAFNNGELFTQAEDHVQISSVAIGVAGNTVGQGEVLDMDFFGTNPTGNISALPTAQASAMYVKIDSIGSADFVVILKLIDPDDNSRTTKAIIVDNEDVYKYGDVIHGNYQITLAQNDGAVIIESNDYNATGENYLIEGAQIISSTEGITGTGINLVKSAIGSTTFQEFEGTPGIANPDADTTDNDGFKILDIGFVTSKATPQDADLTFSFSLMDDDGDSTGTQELNVLIQSGTTIGGTDGNDIISGTGGADTFVWTTDDIGTVGAPGADTVEGFSAGDILNLQDVLPDPATAAHVYAIQDASGTMIHITDGSGDTSGAHDVQTIFLAGFTSDTTANIVNELITNQTYTL